MKDEFYLEIREQRWGFLKAARIIRREKALRPGMKIIRVILDAPNDLFRGPKVALQINQGNLKTVEVAGRVE